jgi:ketosteroid isomerase-like protein
MDRVFQTVVCVLATLVAIVNSPARSAPPASKDSEQLLASERAWAKAAVDGNADAMAKFMSDDYVELTMETDKATNKTRWKNTGKAEWVALVCSGTEKYESVDLRNLRVYLHVDVATVTGEYTQKGSRDGQDISATGLYVNTWVKKNGTWQVVSSVFP